MKKLLLMGAAATFCMTATPVQAQMYDKGSDRILDEARYEEPEVLYQEPVEVQTSEASRLVEIEPAAGADREWYQNFTGPYIGIDGGYTLGSYETSDVNDVGIDGWNYGAFAGFGFEQTFTPLLGGYAGIEVGYSWSEADGDTAGAAYEKDSEILATFRPGVSLSQSALGYGIIGYSRAEFESAGDDDQVNGLVLGVGSEFNTMTALKLRTEYTYTNYDEGDLGAATEFDGHENSVKVGALLRF